MSVTGWFTVEVRFAAAGRSERGTMSGQLTTRPVRDSAQVAVRPAVVLLDGAVRAGLLPGLGAGLGLGAAAAAGAPNATVAATPSAAAAVRMLATRRRPTSDPDVARIARSFC
jgi:hypothetical protein